MARFRNENRRIEESNKEEPLTKPTIACPSSEYKPLRIRYRVRRVHACARSLVTLVVFELVDAVGLEFGAVRAGTDADFFGDAFDTDADAAGDVDEGEAVGAASPGERSARRTVRKPAARGEL